MHRPSAGAPTGRDPLRVRRERGYDRVLSPPWWVADGPTGESGAQSLPRYSFCSSLRLSSRRMNGAATFLAVGDKPAIDPFVALGAVDDAVPAAFASLSSLVTRMKVLSLFA